MLHRGLLIIGPMKGLGILIDIDIYLGERNLVLYRRVLSWKLFSQVRLLTLNLSVHY